MTLSFDYLTVTDLNIFLCNLIGDISCKIMSSIGKCFSLNWSHPAKLCPFCSLHLIKSQRELVNVFTRGEENPLKFKSAFILPVAIFPYFLMCFLTVLRHEMQDANHCIIWYDEVLYITPATSHCRVWIMHWPIAQYLHSPTSTQLQVGEVICILY